MKYIKVYEAFGKGYKQLSNRSTGQGDDDDWSRFTSDKVTKEITDAEVARITKSFPDFFRQRLPSCIGGWIDHKSSYTTKKYVGISKYEDDWFLISDNPYFYACDQVEGVIEYLKSIQRK
jgi:hypothetical protein